MRNVPPNLSIINREADTFIAPALVFCYHSWNE